MLEILELICIMALICCSGCARDAHIDNILDVNTVSAEHTASISAIQTWYADLK